jgi:hydroxymethylpyrimidine/phosphomethylpyrimidine kinase
VDDMQAAAKRLCEMGAKAALVKGGHLQESAVDVLFDGQDWREFTAPHFDTPHTHGTGCTLSAGIAAELARGATIDAAVARAKSYVTQAIRSNPGLGHGAGPLNHHAATGLRASAR